MPLIKFLEEKRVIVGSGEDKQKLGRGTIAAVTKEQLEVFDEHDWRYIELDSDVDPADHDGPVDSEADDYDPTPQDNARELLAEGDWAAKFSFVNAYADEELDDKTEPTLDAWLEDFAKSEDSEADDGDAD